MVDVSSELVPIDEEVEELGVALDVSLDDVVALELVPAVPVVPLAPMEAVSLLVLLLGA